MCIIAVTVATSSLAVIGKAVAPARNGHVKNLLSDLQRGPGRMQKIKGKTTEKRNPPRKTISTYEIAIRTPQAYQSPITNGLRRRKTCAAQIRHHLAIDEARRYKLREHS